ncbi:cytochrome c oxidase accessory protein CcoG [Azospirillum sp. TSO22-1]|uniref:cytochrome c oxidase accessory protein CcoG n=1 Tax=Azospirillum sp. TSO22-1 TaxID=716789 RepID=UPI000D614A6B|nr:cytochrome c oxidase accessory protein CcoG [Azospirillum sp. TSO22-1]PWC56948.1 nitrogen fixation protein FixG [Azospirillum sp. TSO22-1]
MSLSTHAASNPSAADEPGRHWFINRPKVYPAAVTGTFRRLKWAAVIVLLAIYYLTPWIRWDRGPGIPDQAVLVDMPGRRLYFFFIEIWPQEVYYLTGLLILAAIGLFGATTLFGRVWCGYACWQTVWTDLFIWVETKIEGSRTERIRLDKAPMTPNKALRKTAKHIAWMLIGVATGGAWVFYFNDAPTLMRDLLAGQASATVLGFAALFSATCYFFAGWAREQVCIYVCPWRSFQSAMVDEDTYIVTYQDWRGEGRRPLRKSQGWGEREAEGYGDCIDCKVCVHVCPTGTDIRKGQQISCIGCGLCVDACNDVMAQIGRPRDLILFDTQNDQVAKAQGKIVKPRVVRPRTIVYGLILLTVASAMFVSLMMRATVDVNVLRDRAPLFVALSDGSVQNAYTVKVLNKTHDPRTYTLALQGLDNAELSAASLEGHGNTLTITAGPDSVATYRVFVKLPQDKAKSGSTDVTLMVTETGTGEVGTHKSVFMAP